MAAGSFNINYSEGFLKAFSRRDGRSSSPYAKPAAGTTSGASITLNLNVTPPVINATETASFVDSLNVGDQKEFVVSTIVTGSVVPCKLMVRESTIDSIRINWGATS